MSERPAVQNPLLKYADEIGWTYMKPEEALRLRGGDTGLYFTEVLEAQLLRFNPGIVGMARAADIKRAFLQQPRISAR